MPARASVTYTAVTPDGHEAVRKSRTQTYTHARWIKFPDKAHEVIISWHRSEETAQRSPFQAPGWKTYQWGIVPVTASVQDAG